MSNERERGLKADSKVFDLSHRKRRAAIDNTGKTIDETRAGLSGALVGDLHSSRCLTNCLFNFRRGREELIVKITKVLNGVTMTIQKEGIAKSSEDLEVLVLFQEVMHS